VKRLFVAVLVMGGAVVLADTPSPTKSITATIVATHFSHANHQTRGIDTITPDKCVVCHSIDAKGQVLAPASQGHSPCLEAKCHAGVASHAKDFLMIGTTAAGREKNAKASAERAAKDPKHVDEFQRAAGFCKGCHEDVPWAWKKPGQKILNAWRNQREHHVEMPHYRHTQMKTKDNKTIGCRTCHVVGEAGKPNEYQLSVGTPGHAQCVQCHNATDYPQHTMAKCGGCHEAPSRAEYLKKALDVANIRVDPDKGIETRPGSDVRECNSAGKDLEDKKKKRSTHCFKHETKGHRTDLNAKADTEVQCKTCHYIVADASKWGVLGAKYEAISDLHIYKIITGKGTKDEQHVSCSGKGTCHVHEKLVELKYAEHQCDYCHANSENSSMSPF